MKTSPRHLAFLIIILAAAVIGFLAIILKPVPFPTFDYPLAPVPEKSPAPPAAIP